MVEGQYKGMVEEADKEKPLKQVVKANLNERTLELSLVQRQVTMVENSREVAEKTNE